MAWTANWVAGRCGGRVAGGRRMCKHRTGEGGAAAAGRDMMDTIGDRPRLGQRRSGRGVVEWRGSGRDAGVQEVSPTLGGGRCPGAGARTGRGPSVCIGQREPLARRGPLFYRMRRKASGDRPKAALKVREKWKASPKPIRAATCLTSASGDLSRSAAAFIFSRSKYW